MSDDQPITLREAAKGVTVRCQVCHGVVRGGTSECTARCGCETPQPSESIVALDAMLDASRRGRTIR